MRRLTLPPVFLCLCSLAFAPAPLPRPDGERPARKRERRLAECRRRLDELGVEWKLVPSNEGVAVRFTVRVRRGGMGGTFGVSGDRDLVNTLLAVISAVENFARRGAPLPPP